MTVVTEAVKTVLRNQVQKGRSVTSLLNCAVVHGCGQKTLPGCVVCCNSVLKAVMKIQ